eukprot:365946-Chlamydomonas_euryale.AAC.16
MWAPAGHERRAVPRAARRGLARRAARRSRCRRCRRRRVGRPDAAPAVPCGGACGGGRPAAAEAAVGPGWGEEGQGQRRAWGQTRGRRQTRARGEEKSGEDKMALDLGGQSRTSGRKLGKGRAAHTYAACCAVLGG